MSQVELINSRGSRENTLAIDLCLPDSVSVPNDYCLESAMTRHAFALALAITATACVQVETGVYEAPSDELAPYIPTAEQKTEVAATLQLLFDALETGDEALLRSVTDPSVVMRFTKPETASRLLAPPLWMVWQSGSLHQQNLSLSDSGTQ